MHVNAVFNAERIVIRMELDQLDHIWRLELQKQKLKVVEVASKFSLSLTQDAPCLLTNSAAPPNSFSY